MRVGLFLKYDREIGRWSENREIPDLWGRVDRYVDNFTGFGKLHVSSDQENYYSWNKNSIIQCIFQNCTVGKGTDITLLHYTCKI